MFSPFIIMSAIIVIIIFFIVRSSIKAGRSVRNNTPRKDETIFSKDENISAINKTTFSGDQQSIKRTSTTALCKTCNDTKMIKCRLCNGFGFTNTTRFGPPTTVMVPKMRTTFDAKGRPSYQHYTEMQTKPGKIETIRQSCGRCMGRGNVKCPDC